MASGASRGRLWLINGLIAAVVILAIGGTVYALTMGSQNSTEGLRTTTLGRGTVAETVTASGTVTTSRNATVNFNVTGRLASVRVKLGDRVRKGQVLATLDARFAKQNAEAAELRVDADEKQVDAARVRVKANKQALDAAEAAADVPINERSGATGATGGSSGQAAMGGTSTGAGMGGVTGTGAQAAGGAGGAGGATAAGGAQGASPQAAAQPQVAQPPAQPQAAPAPAQQQAAPAPQAIPVQPPWWCFWCSVTYVYPPAPTTPSTTPPATAMPTTTPSAAVPTTTPSAGAGAGAAQSTASQGPSKKQRNATEEQDDANVKAAKAQLAESEATLAGNEATLASDRANLISARNSVDDIELVAPQDGAVATVDGQVGQIVGPQGIVLSGTNTGNPTGGRLPDGTAVTSGAQGNGTSSSGSSGGSSGSNSGGGGGGGGSSSSGSTSSGGNGTSVTASPVVPAVLTLIGTDQMQVRADVPELDIGRVANGQQVDVRVNALPDDKVGGTVASVNLLPGSGDTVQYGTNVALPTPPQGLRPGMSANVTITTRSVPNVPFLPSSAVRSSGEGAKTGTVDVLTGPDNRRETRTIGLGLSSDAVTEITSGLRDGEVVVLPDPAPQQGGGGGGGGGGR